MLRRIHPANYLFILFAFVISFAACETIGYDNVDTTRKTIVVANAEVRAANLLLQDLIGRNAVTRGQATEALNNLQIAKNTLQTALDAIDAGGDPALQSSALQRANISISVVLNLLAPFVDT